MNLHISFKWTKKLKRTTFKSVVSCYPLISLKTGILLTHSNATYQLQTINYSQHQNRVEYSSK